MMWNLTPNCLNEECNSIGDWDQMDESEPVTVESGQFHFNQLSSVGGTGIVVYLDEPLPPAFPEIPDYIFSFEFKIKFGKLYNLSDNKGCFTTKIRLDGRITGGVAPYIDFYIYKDRVRMGSAGGDRDYIEDVPLNTDLIFRFDVLVDRALETYKVNYYLNSGFGFVHKSTKTGLTYNAQAYNGGYSYFLYGWGATDQEAWMEYAYVGRPTGVNLPLLSSSVDISVCPIIEGTVNLPLLTIDNEMLDNRILEMPMLRFDSNTIVGKMVSSSPSLPLLGVDANLRFYDLQTSLSMPLLSIDGNVTYYNRYADITITLPAITGMAYGGGAASITLPAIVSVSSGTVSRVGTVTIVLPSMIASVTGLVSEVGNVSIILPPITAKVLGHSNILATVAAILPVLDIVSTGLTGEVASAGITLPSIKSISTAWWNSGATVSVIIPAIRVSANAVILTTDYEVLVINTKNMALTNYISYAYNSLCEFNGKHFGAKSSGIYELSGTTDNGSSISWKIKTGKLDMQENEKHSPKKKYVLLSYHPSGDLTLTVIGKEEEYEYDVESYEETDGVSRIKLGKGIRDKYLQFELKNKNGESVFLDKMKIFSDKAMTR